MSGGWSESEREKRKRRARKERRCARAASPVCQTPTCESPPISTWRPWGGATGGAGVSKGDGAVVRPWRAQAGGGGLLRTLSSWRLAPKLGLKR